MIYIIPNKFYITLIRSATTEAKVFKCNRTLDNSPRSNISHIAAASKATAISAQLQLRFHAEFSLAS